jgi:outer membrane receptor protein involved in Fe transport
VERARPNKLRWTAKRKPPRPWITITAEDVGSFPDQNINEAISRVAAIALDRGDEARVEAFRYAVTARRRPASRSTAMAVLNTSGSLAGGASAATGGRSADLRELPAAIIKSIDVFKGTTAAMTEGSLGGSVRIETRNSLEFDKPFIQFSTDGQRNSITDTLTPGGSLMFARNFHGQPFWLHRQRHLFEFRVDLGFQQGQTSGNAGPFRSADFRSIAGQDLYLRSEHR